MENKCLLCGESVNPTMGLNVVMEDGSKIHLNCASRRLKGKELTDSNINELIGSESKREIRNAMLELKEAISEVSPYLDNLDDKLNNLKDILQNHKQEKDIFREALDILEREYLNITVAPTLEELNENLITTLEL